MSHPWFHAVSSAKKHGGEPEDYLPIHDFFDSGKATFADPRHRSLLHHSFGIYIAERVFGPTITTSSGGTVPTRIIGEGHVLEDFGRIPTVADFLRHMTIEKWMVKGARPLSRELGSPDPPEPPASRPPVTLGMFQAG